MAQTHGQDEPTRAARARSGDGRGSSPPGTRPDGAPATRTRFLLSLQQAAGNRAVSRLVVPRQEALEPNREANETGLPDRLKSGVESLSGMSLDSVRVHYDSARPRQLDALAYTQGADIHVAPGQEQHLPHEAWHVVQQAQGRVQATTELADGIPLNDDRALEQEADAMGSNALATGGHRQDEPAPPAGGPDSLLQRRFRPPVPNGRGSRSPDVPFVSSHPVQGAASNPAGVHDAGDDVSTLEQGGLSRLVQRWRSVAGAPTGDRSQRGGGPSASRPIQAIMSVAEFQAATPKKVLAPRSAVVAIDGALGTYVQARTALNAVALIGVVQNYAGGNHDAARIQVARALERRAVAEHRLLQQIGDNNAFLVDALIDQATEARIDQLVQLATDATGANATVLPSLINTIGPANINNLNTSQLVPRTGAAHLPLLPAMITQCGGMAQRNELSQIINRHPGAGDLAFDLTREAAGNGPLFTRLAAEVPQFLRTAAPGGVLPPAAALAVANYNAAIDPRLIAELNNLANAATAALAIAQAVHPGLAGGLVNNVNNRIVAVQNRSAALAGGPPAVRAAGDANLAQQARNIIANALNAAIAGPLAAAPPPAPANFQAQVAAVNNANTLIANTAIAPTINTVNFDHFLARHTAHYFDFTDIKPDNTQWDTAWAANAATNVGAAFAQVLNGLAAAGNWLMPGNPIPNRACPGGGTAQIAGLAAPGGQINVGQFFPESTPAANMHDHPDTTMRAILKVL
jgi:hypothetical protein